MEILLYKIPKRANTPPRVTQPALTHEAALRAGWAGTPPPYGDPFIDPEAPVGADDPVVVDQIVDVATSLLMHELRHNASLNIYPPFR